MRRLACIAAALSLAGCSFGGAKPTPQPDVDASVADAPAGPCEVSTPPSCAGDAIRSCPDGTGFVDTPCDVTCLSEPTVRCASFTPANGVGFGDGTVDFVVDAAFIFNTANGQIRDGDGVVVRSPVVGVDAGIDFQQVPQPGAPTIGVFAFNRLTVSAAGSIRVVGSTDHPIALVAKKEVVIDGVIDNSAGSLACPSLGGQNCSGIGGGAGGGPELPGFSPIGTDGVGAPGTADINMGGGESGGGGGGYRTAGGSSGASGLALGASGGLAFGNMLLSPLAGGAGGGGGAIETEDLSAMNECNAPAPYQGGVGGGGGGAIQIVAGTDITLTADTCIIDVSGGGGTTGECEAGGGGGGAGGGILLEAPRIDAGGNCVIVANGGGGGAGNAFGDGSNGLRSPNAAPGGGTGENQAGGIGAVDQNGGDSLDDVAATGGGGGGSGRIVIRTLGNGFSGGAVISPTGQRAQLGIF